MSERDWGKEREELLEAIGRAQTSYNALFGEVHAKMKAMTLGRDPGDHGLVRRVEAADAKLRKARDDLYRHAEEQLRSLGW
jgi:hypothetical protein